MKPIVLIITALYLGLLAHSGYGQEQDRIYQVIPPRVVPILKDDIYTYELKEGILVGEVITQSGVVRKMYLKKGAKTFYHNHPEEETLVVISGKLKALTADGEHILDPGDVISLESYAEHQLEGMEDDTYIVQSFSAGREIVKPDF